MQNLISNDVAKVTRTRAVFATLLTPQGKYLHDFFVVEMEVAGKTALVLDTEAGRLTDLNRRLTMYMLRANVELRDVSGDFATVAALSDRLCSPASAAACGARTFSVAVPTRNGRTCRLSSSDVSARQTDPRFSPLQQSRWPRSRPSRTVVALRCRTRQWRSI